MTPPIVIVQQSSIWTVGSNNPAGDTCVEGVKD